MEIVHTAEVDTAIGSCRIASTEKGLAYVELPHASGWGLGGWLRRCVPGADLVQAFAPNRVAVAQIREFLEGKRAEFDIPLDLRGTEFQQQVWSAVLEIPYAETRTYQDVARSVGRPRASRAVGGAVSANPVPLVVPCHRVVAAAGKLGGFGGGLDLKARLLAMERSRPSQGRLL
jgi:O-6-methylguanine DNA methyltransferase